MDWPILKTLQEQKALSYMDISFAEVLGCREEEHAAFAIYLLLACRCGHLCVQKVKGEGWSPSPLKVLELTSKEKENDCNELHFSEFSSLIEQGELPHHLLTQVEKGCDKALTPFIQERDCFYLQRFWKTEKEIQHHLNRISSTPPFIQMDEKQVVALLDQWKKDLLITGEQSEGLAKVCSQALTPICGGPGTGKTYTAGRLIQLFLELLPAGQILEISLCAPTGKAAAQLKRSLLEKINLEEHPNSMIHAQTLHALLGIREGGVLHSSQEILSADLLIVDESSMISGELMALLLSRIKCGARLVLLGDPAQLPSIDPGQVFADILQLPLGKPAILRHCLRTDLKEIITFAQSVKEQNVSVMFEALTSSQSLEWLSVFDVESQLEKFPSPFFKEEALSVLHLERFSQYRILSPKRKGNWGIEQQNTILLRRMLLQVPHGTQYMVPIMITQNDYRHELFNGEVGLLVKKKKRTNELYDFYEEDFAIFETPSSERGYRKIIVPLLPRFELSYAISIHKSQGSEFNEIALLLPEGSDLFGKEILYTGATRAKEKISLYASEQTLKQILLQDNHRKSGIKTYVNDSK